MRIFSAIEVKASWAMWTLNLTSSEPLWITSLLDVCALVTYNFLKSIISFLPEGIYTCIPRYPSTHYTHMNMALPTYFILTLQISGLPPLPQGSLSWFLKLPQILLIRAFIKLYHFLPADRVLVASPMFVNFELQESRPNGNFCFPFFTLSLPDGIVHRRCKIEDVVHVRWVSEWLLSESIRVTPGHWAD